MSAAGGCGSGGCGGQGDGGGCASKSNGKLGNGFTATANGNVNGKPLNGFAPVSNGTNAKGRANASGPSARLAVAVSGGYSSSTMAHLAYLYLESIQRAPGQVSPPIILFHSYTDETALTAVTKLADQIPRSQLRILQNTSSDGDRPRLADKNDELLLNNIELRKKLVAHTDKDYNLLFGTNATRNSVKILEAIVHGRPGIPGVEKLIEPLVGVRARLLYRYARHTFSAAEMDFAGNEHHQSPFLQAISRFIIRAEADNSSAVHNVGSTVSKLTQVQIECKLCSDAPTPTPTPAVLEGNGNIERRIEIDQELDSSICSPCRNVLKRVKKKSGDSHAQLMEFIWRGVESL